MANGKLLMTFDCLKEGHSVKNAMTSMDRISAKAGWTAKAISVMSPDQVNWPGDFTSNWQTEFQNIGKTALGKFLKRNRRKGAIESKILFQPYHSRKGSVQRVLTEIDSSKPAAIAVFSHTQPKTASLPGGFVGSIISKSGAPVFVLNAKAPALKSLKTVLFATDFSDIDETSYNEALSFVKGTGAKLIVTHVLPNLVNETMTAYAGITGGWNAFDNYLSMQENETNATAELWIKKAQALGIDARYEILNNSKSISNGILKSAKKNDASIIVMTEKTGPWEAVFIGSVTREILELSTTPVLVIPSNVKPQRAKKMLTEWRNL